MGNGTYVVPGWWWYHYAGVVRDKYTEGLKLLRCPSSRLDDPMMDKDLICGKYGVNRALCKVSPGWVNPLYNNKDFVGAPLSIGDLEQAGSTLLIVDSGFSLICWWNATACPPVPLDTDDIEATSYVPGLEINKDKLLQPGQTWDAIGGRHPNKTVNVGFADGHADPMPAHDLLVEKTGDGQYTNTRLWLGR
jgi:prepilin-type processing-associated H-X9-DG protein